MADPTTPGGLWDLIARELGVGSGPRPGEPEYRYRSRQVGILERQLARHHVTVAELVATVAWMKRRGKWATTLTQVFLFLPQAQRERDRSRIDTGFERAYEAAIAIERTNPDSSFYPRLLRAHGAHRREVYAQWQAKRRSMSRRYEEGRGTTAFRHHHREHRGAEDDDDRRPSHR